MMMEETKKQDNFLQLKDITTTFGSIVALNNVNFRVNSGDFVSLIGPSGCGKSTLLRTANWLTPPDKGTVSLDGVLVGSESNKNMNLNEMKVLNGIRARMGMVFQQFNVWPHLDALENVVRAQLVVAKRSREEVGEGTTADLEFAIQDQGSNLSGGQKQRICIARALAAEPELIICDEVTSALDQIVQEGILKLHE